MTGGPAKSTLDTARPVIAIGSGGGTALPAVGTAKLMYAVVDSQLHLPDMFEIAFFTDPDVVCKEIGLDIGTEVTIKGTAPKATSPVGIVVGEVTAVEAEFATSVHTVVRGYSADHRLQRRRKTRTFLNMKLSDVARKIAGDAGLTVGTIEQTRTVHDHIGQVNQTDWDFLVSRARTIGYEVGIIDGEFTFRQAAGARGLAGTVTLDFAGNLLTFRPRVTAANLAEKTEVRVWDPLAAKVTAAQARSEARSVRLNGTQPRDLAAIFGDKAAAKTRSGGTADYGPPPGEDAYVISDWPLAGGASAGAACEEAVAGVAEHVAGTFAEAEGEAMGHPGLRAGAAVEITGVSERFSGTWVATRSRHVFDSDGYHVRFEVSGQQDRSLLGLTAGRSSHRGSPLWSGVVCGVVTNNNDPEKKGRVKLILPWLSPLYETDWAPVSQAGAGSLSGAMFLPEVGDEVLVGFEFGDPQRAYVLGGVVNNKSTYQLGGPPIKVKGAASAVVWRGIVSATGNRLAFHDELADPEGRQPPTASDLVLGTKDGGMALTIDQTAGTVALTCEPTPPTSKTAAGAVTIACGDTGTIDIKTGTGGTVNIDGGAQLNLRAQAGIKIESQGVVQIKGAQVKLN